MAKRYYGGIPNTVKPPAEEPVISQSEVLVEESSVKNSSIFDKFNNKLNIKVVIAACAAIVVCGTCGIFYYRSATDAGFGFKDPEVLALEYTETAFKSHGDIWDYVPKAVRDTNMASFESLWMLVDESQGMNVKMENIKAEKSESISGMISELEKGYEDFYGKTVKIKDAMKVTLSADISYNTPKLKYMSNTKDYNKSVDFDVICVQIGSKWYVYTGGHIDSDKISIVPENVFAIDEEDLIPDPDLDYEGKPEPEEEYIPEIPEVDAYEGAASDLRAGRVTIDGAEFILPIEYSKLESVLKIKADVIKDEDRFIESGKILKNLPAAYVNEEYSAVAPGISIANPYDSAKDLTEGIISTLYLTKPISTTKKYPEIILPGNITIGTTYDDVISVYGDDVLMTYDGKNDDITKLNYTSDVKIYTVDLNNDYNRLYLMFDVDNKLMAIRWQYIDLNGLVDTN